MRTQVTWLRTPGPQPTPDTGPNETKWDPQGEEGKKVWVMVSTLGRIHLAAESKACVHVSDDFSSLGTLHFSFKWDSLKGHVGRTIGRHGGLST